MTSEPPTHVAVTVILAIRNAAVTLSEQLEALAAQNFTGRWELLVVDNGSSDRGAAIVEEMRGRLPELRVVPAFNKVGLAYARNVGAAAARGAILAFCDGDDIVDPGWVAALADRCAAYELVGGVLDVDSINSREVITWRGGSPTGKGLPVALNYLPFAVGASFAVQAETYEAVGGMDEFFQTCCDDVDFSWRVQEQGGRLGLASEAVTQYRLRSELAQAVRQQFRYGQMSAWLAVKHPAVPPATYPSGELLYLLTRTPLIFLSRDRRRGRYLCAAAWRAGSMAGTIAVRRSRAWSRIRGDDRR
jgi:glycosyltransferase involved in cell wall biosynthesis